MSQGGHPEDLPVARLKIYRFSGRDAVTYPLYKGINKAGRDPRKVRVYLPWDNCLDTHAAIGMERVYIVRSTNHGGQPFDSLPISISCCLP
ncbi:hypothetical protein BC939DRAFT_175710 [Gamsiella multidivaricata]|uniref:uncharacterized protein n=1 Tax=Gamsiella multidivaricata TaxID=101098 RepID=UPI00221F01BD|nr:uncharacterized protein BC939DRAFT_175710 [Gamsiella multidivaricata]KAI7822653.1 hypothetical protein BC939DRAFT_175710 [Gamsiella multidivaricata]